MRVLRAIERVQERVVFIGAPAACLLLMYLLPFLERHDPRWSQWTAAGILMLLVSDYFFASLAGFVEGLQADDVVRGFAQALRRMRQRLVAYPAGLAFCSLVFAVTLFVWLVVGGGHAAAALRLAFRVNLPVYVFQLKLLVLEYAMLATLWGMGEIFLSMSTGVWSGSIGDERQDDLELQ